MPQKIMMVEPTADPVAAVKKGEENIDSPSPQGVDKKLQNSMSKNRIR
jgi:hypothetical protein